MTTLRWLLVALALSAAAYLTLFGGAPPRDVAGSTVDWLYYTWGRTP